MTGLVMICCYSIYKRRSITIKGLYISTSSLRKWVVVLTSACAEAENLGGQGGLEPPPLFDKGGLSPPKIGGCHGDINSLYRMQDVFRMKITPNFMNAEPPHF